MSPRSSSPLALEPALLGLLYHQPAHGYDLHRKMTAIRVVSMLWSVKQSQLYALLDKLEDQGLVSSELVPGEAHLMRKQYQLTSAGKHLLLNWMEEPVKHPRDMRQGFLVRLYFARQIDQAAALRLVEQQRVICRGWLAGLEKQAQKEEPCTDEYIILRFRILQIQGMLSWLDECQELASR
jgi:PadR family transcriptional regulator, regulatory protein AphA